ncbi:hypothetical protein [Clostridium sporogenes]|uniref:hypothetical protein n=1 Tax=Clostridium sporogenes TaxID=1509 RepID=UPI0006B28FA4|nr:hypothetical protein [Clostridium sporogenes]KOY65477.1 hypothetical protein AN649_13470 [Clostridium sporogenes]MDS1006582.1 hypothetical protein [Clostridium sporogenes]
MEKIFINKLNNNQKILVTEEYIELLEYKTSLSSISDLYYLKQTGFIEKCECSKGIKRNENLSGGGINSCISIWNLRKGWKPVLKIILNLNEFNEVINLITKKIDNKNLFIKK